MRSYKDSWGVTHNVQTTFNGATHYIECQSNIVGVEAAVGEHLTTRRRFPTCWWCATGRRVV